MIFEDFMMLLMDALVIVGFFKVPMVTDKSFKASSLYMQLGTTCLSLYLTFKALFF